MLRTGIKVVEDSNFPPALSYTDFDFHEHCMLGKQIKSANMYVKGTANPLKMLHSHMHEMMPMVIPYPHR